MRLAVLLTCYNRKEKTLNCIKNLLPQLEKMDLEYRIYICDDKSTDGSYESLKKLLPEHEIHQSSGDFYWSKGMYAVMCMAINDACDYYLMINDDVDFGDDALDIMFKSLYKAGGKCGIVGSTLSKKDGSLTYGGRNNLNSNKPIMPEKSLVKCIYANWNCFLIDKNVVNQVGSIDGKYQHGYGDYDYSLRMKKKGIPIYVANKIVGYCEKNSKVGTFRDINLRRRQRLKGLLSPKGIPLYSFFRYYIKNEGIKKIPACLYGYGTYIVSILLKRSI